MVVELVHAEVQNRLAPGHPEVALSLYLRRQAMAIPAKAALDSLAAHGLIARHQVFDVSRHNVAIVGQSIGKRRAVVEDKFIAIARWPLLDTRLKNPLVFPELLNLFLNRRKVRIRIHVGIEIRSHTLVLNQSAVYTLHSHLQMHRIATCTMLSIPYPNCPVCTAEAGDTQPQRGRSGIDVVL